MTWFKDSCLNRQPSLYLSKEALLSELTQCSQTPFPDHLSFVLASYGLPVSHFTGMPDTELIMMISWELLHLTILEVIKTLMLSAPVLSGHFIIFWASCLELPLELLYTFDLIFFFWSVFFIFILNCHHNPQTGDAHLPLILNHVAWRSTLTHNPAHKSLHPSRPPFYILLHCILHPYAHPWP